MKIKTPVGQSMFGSLRFLKLLSSQLVPELFTAPEAVGLLRVGYRMARAGWHEKGMYVYTEHREGYRPQTTIVLPDGTRQPGWVMSQTDMRADDWFLLSIFPNAFRFSKGDSDLEIPQEDFEAGLLRSDDYPEFRGDESRFRYAFETPLIHLRKEGVDTFCVIEDCNLFKAWDVLLSPEDDSSDSSRETE